MKKKIGKSKLPSAESHFFHDVPCPHKSPREERALVFNLIAHVISPPSQSSLLLTRSGVEAGLPHTRAALRLRLAPATTPPEGPLWPHQEPRLCVPELCSASKVPRVRPPLAPRLQSLPIYQTHPKSSQGRDKNTAGSFPGVGCSPPVYLIIGLFICTVYEFM